MFLWQRLRGQRPLLSGSQFEYDNRPSRDTFWGYLYLFCLALTVAGGVFGIVNRNQSFDILNREQFLNDATHCPIHRTNEQLVRHHDHDQVDPTYFLESAGILVAISLGAALLVSLAFLVVVKHSAHALVYITVLLQISIPLVAAVSAFQAGNTDAGSILLISTALLALFFILFRQKLDLVARLLSLAARSLQDNPGVIVFTILMKLLLLIVMSFLSVSIFAALLNGKVLPNPERHGKDVCVDIYGEQISCCVWQPRQWVSSFISLAAATLAWSLLLLFELKVFTVSGVVAQWYFAPVGATTYRGNTLRSLRHAVGPSFGSLCLGSAILLLLSKVRQVAARLRQRRDCGLIGCLLAGVLSLVYTLLEGLTKFATVRMAITGEAFLSAGKAVVGLLARNAMDTAGVWWLPPVVLHSCALVVSAGWGAGVYYVSHQYWGDSDESHSSALVLALVSGLFAWLMLGYFCSLLLNMVDALFVCYAMDRDRHTVSRPEAHECFYLLPAAGGAAAAGAPAAGAAGQAHDAMYPAIPPLQPAYAPPQLVPSYYPEAVTYGYPVQRQQQPAQGLCACGGSASCGHVCGAICAAKAVM